MVIDPAGDVTRLLGEIAAGNETAKNYEELHAMAERHMKQGRPGHTLGATGLVHEVYLRLKGQALEKNRPYFFAAVAKAMYRILVERARQSQKHPWATPRLQPKGNQPPVHKALLGIARPARRRGHGTAGFHHGVGAAERPGLPRLPQHRPRR